MSGKEASLKASLMTYARMNDWFTIPDFNESAGFPRGNPPSYTAANSFAKAGRLEKQRKVVGGVGRPISHYRYRPAAKPKKATRRPVPQRQVSIKKSWHVEQLIDFYASDEIAMGFEEFGEIECLNGSLKRLYVDGRYDFIDVLAFIDEYDYNN